MRVVRVMVAVAAVGTVLALGVAGGGDPVAVVAAALVAAAALAYTLRARLPEPAPRPAAAPVVGGAEPSPASLSALEALPDPLLLVSAAEPDDMAGRRVVFANAPARDLLRIPREGGLLLGVIRRPEVLEAIDQSLFADVPSVVAYDTGGAQERFWRVWTRPLSSAASPGGALTLVILRDETDVRRTERMRADFLANASHELRTPLASLAGFIETLRGHATRRRRRPRPVPSASWPSRPAAWAG